MKKDILSHLSATKSLFTLHQRKYGEGNVFTRVCHFVHRGGGRACLFSACITGHIIGLPNLCVCVGGGGGVLPYLCVCGGGLPYLEGSVCMQTPPPPSQVRQTPTHTPTHEYNRIPSTSGRYASYWNAYLLAVRIPSVVMLALTRLKMGFNPIPKRQR